MESIVFTSIFGMKCVYKIIGPSNHYESLNTNKCFEFVCIYNL